MPALGCVFAVSFISVLGELVCMVDVLELMVDLAPIYESTLATSVLLVVSVIGMVVTGKICYEKYIESVEVESPKPTLLFDLMGWFGIAGGFFSVFGGSLLFLQGGFGVGELVIHFFPFQAGIGVLSIFVLGPIIQKYEAGREVGA